MPCILQHHRKSTIKYPNVAQRRAVLRNTCLGVCSVQYFSPSLPSSPQVFTMVLHIVLWGNREGTQSWKIENVLFLGQRDALRSQFFVYTHWHLIYHPLKTKRRFGYVWWYTPDILAQRRMMQENHSQPGLHSKIVFLKQNKTNLDLPGCSRHLCTKCHMNQ